MSLLEAFLGSRVFTPSPYYIRVTGPLSYITADLPAVNTYEVRLRTRSQRV